MQVIEFALNTLLMKSVKESLKILSRPNMGFRPWLMYVFGALVALR